MESITTTTTTTSPSSSSSAVVGVVADVEKGEKIQKCSPDSVAAKQESSLHHDGGF